MRAFCFKWLLLLVTAGLDAQTVPQWVKAEDAARVPELKLSNSNNGYYYLLIDEQYNTVLRENFFHYAYKITSESGTSQGSQIEASFDANYQKLQFNILRIIRNGEVINKLDQKKFKTLNEESDRRNGMLYSRTTIYRNLEDVRVGDVVEYAFTIKGYREFFGNSNAFRLNLQYAEELGEIHYRLIFDKKNKPSVHTFNTTAKFQTDSSAGMFTYEYTSLAPKALIVEENYPSWFDPYPTAVFTNYASWLDFKKLNRNIVLNKRNENHLVPELFKKLTANCFTEEEKLTKLADYVQNSVRYSGNESGIYTHVAHAPDQVINNLFGDCKDKSVLLCELLSQMGVKAYPALIATEYKSEIKKLPPTHLWFNHCIVAIKKPDGKFFFIDPTISMQGGSFMERKVPEYEIAMVLDNSEDLFVNIPADLTSGYDILEQFNIIPGTSTAELAVTTTYKGANADNIRYYFRDNSIAKVQLNYKEYYIKYTTNIEVIDTVQFIDDIKKNICIVKERYYLYNFWKANDTSKSKDIEKSFIPYSLNDLIIYADKDKRLYPLLLTYPANITQVIEVKNESGWDVPANSFELNNNHFRYSFTTTTNGQLLRLSYKFNVRKKYVAPKDYKEYKEQADLLDKNIVFTSLTRHTDPPQFNYIFLVAVIITFILLAGAIWLTQHFRISTSYYNRYDSIGGWLIVVAINLVISPLLLITSVVDAFKDAMLTDYAQFYFYKGATIKEYFLGICEIGVNQFNIFMFFFSFYVLYLFFTRKNNFRIVFICIKLFNILFLVFNSFYLSYYNSSLNNYEIQMTIYKQWGVLGRVVFGFLIWGSYIWFSERSRHTFTVGNRNEKAEGTEIYQ